MTPASVKSLSTLQLVEQYREVSARHGRAIEDGDPRSANRDFDELAAIRAELHGRGLEARRQLLPLLNDSAPGTRCWAATDVLDFAPVEGEQTLSELAKTPGSLVGFTAEQTLVQWRAGALPKP